MVDENDVISQRFPRNQPLLVATDDCDSPESDRVEAPTPITRMTRIGFEPVERGVERAGAVQSPLRSASIDDRTASASGEKARSTTP